MDILAIGEALVEFVRMDSDQASTLNNTKTTNRPLYSQGFGGDTSNMIIAASRQGADTGYISAVGGDPLGKELLALWQAEKVDCSGVSVFETDPTGVYFVQPHASGRYFSYARRGSAASRFSKSDLPLDAIAQASILHTSAISLAISESMREAVFEACHHARRNNTLVTFDTNLRLNLWDLDTARQVIEELLPLVDIVLPSDDEASQLCGTDDSESIIGYFQQKGPDMVILTSGDAGAVVSNNDQRITVNAARAEPVDSTGAGDSFAGSFIAYYVETKDLEYATRCAAICAAKTVSGYGAIDPIPYRDTVVQLANNIA